MVQDCLVHMKKKETLPEKAELLQGTLDMLIMQTLQWGPEHGHGMAKLIGRLCRGLHGQRGNGAEMLRTRLHQLGELLVLDARKHTRQCGRLAVEEGLRTNRDDLHVDLRSRHVPEPPVQVPTAARKVAVHAAGDIEGAELLIGLRELRSDLWRLALQQPDRIFRQDMRVNIDGFCSHWVRCSK